MCIHCVFVCAFTVWCLTVRYLKIFITDQSTTVTQYSQESTKPHFHFWLNLNFVDCINSGYRIKLYKSELDRACKYELFSPQFHVELHFSPVVPSEEEWEDDQVLVKQQDGLFVDELDPHHISQQVDDVAQELELEYEREKQK